MASSPRSGGAVDADLKMCVCLRLVLTNSFLHLACNRYLLVRDDLRMKPGKVAAQCAHAAIGAYKAALVHGGATTVLRAWESSGAAKVVLRVRSEEALWQCHDAVAAKTTTHYVVDEGRTQVSFYRHDGKLAKGRFVCSHHA
jgi:PTH2 family peptidyl-tRNA hydrolase